jgi:hypothetical protein
MAWTATAVALLGMPACAGPGESPETTATDDRPSMIPIETRPTEPPADPGAVSGDDALSEPVDPDEATDLRADTDPDEDPGEDALADPP